ncbi:MAG TPA: CoA-acylating methylmalonate-semialdehyde dehydrogenase, partial [Aliiroseovarius sp.]|nr:CoA-acylating methylmalonate-semialdehyde dehydrogenase [Aliiroseovarius sp.]
EMTTAIEKAAKAQVAWGAMNPQKRGRVMMEMVRLLNRDMDKLAEALSREHGKTIPDAKGDVQRGLEVIEFSIGAPHLLKGEYTDNAGPGIDMYSMRQPLGVVGIIMPFNFPAMMPLWHLGPALACGNAAVYKPSEKDPSVAMMLAELFIEAGLPEGVFQVVNGDKEAVDTLLDSPVVQGISFVGSTPVAKYIYARATASGKRAQCFGGAKNHMIIMPDADLDQAADALVGAGYGAAGERCMAISVAVPVGEETANRLIEKLVPRIEALKVAPYTAGDDVDYGPVVTREAKERILGLIDKGVEEGAKLVVDNRDFKLQGYENGFFVGPHLFDHVTPDMEIYKTEIFGPVLSTVRAGSYEEALKLAMHHEYGNGTAIFTRDGDTARDFAHRVNIGMVGINVPIPVPLAYHSFGGWKKSMFGDLNQHGTDGFKFYSHTKTVTSRWPSGLKEGGEFHFKAMD